MIRVGFVGCGQRAREHCAVLRDFEGDLATEFAAFYDLAPPKSRELAGKFGGESVSSLDKFAAVPLDAVWICLPPRAHPLAINLLLKKGQAICLEPPLGAQIQTANAIQSAAKRANAPLLVSSPWRYSENFERLKKILGAKGAPPVCAISGVWSADWPLAAWRREEKSAGIWLESAWPLLDGTRALCGAPRRVFGTSGGREIARKFGEGGAPDAASLLLEWENGSVGNLTSARVGPEFWRLEIVRSDGVFRWQNDVLEIERGDYCERFLETESPLARQNRAFLRFATSGKRLENRSPLAEILKTQKLALAAQKSLKSARWLSLSP